MNTAKPTIKSCKSPMVAAILNLIPLAGLAGWYGTQVVKRDIAFLSVLSLLIFVWGLGYLYLQRWPRFVLAMIAPWVLCPVSFFFGPRDVELTWLLEGRRITEAFISIFIIMGSAILITALDALRLASRYNAELGSAPAQSQLPS